ncbi:MAG: ATPase, T2SS/T4P/T4SS family [Lentisphaeria bacterium]
MVGQDDFIIDLMLARGLINEDIINQAKEKQHDESLESVLEALYAMKVVSDSDITQLLAAEYGMDTYDFEHAKENIPDEVIQMIPGKIAKRYEVVPISMNSGILRIAMADPADIESLDVIRHLMKMDVEGVIASRKQISKALDFYYGSEDGTVDQFLSDMTEVTTDITIGTTSDVTTEVDGQGNEEDAAPIIRFVSLMIIEAFRTRSSDIHLEPMEKRFRIRYRIDGVLNEVESPPKYLQNKILSRLKLMAGMDLSEHRIPQDGRIRITAMGRELDLRVSDIPITHGESIVMRILDKSGVMLGISELGFLEDDQEIIYKILNLPDGIFLVTGPTGSGKTTSLYSFLHTLNQPTRKIITAEDPVEYELSGINQVQINSDIGLTFVAALRAMLRQAPNIIMVGEIRDSETGEIAINAALTGHLVFSTLHTNDAPSAITRLIDMHIKPFLIASSLRAVMAQRLLRRLCKQCKAPYTLTEPEIEQLGVTQEFLKKANFMKGPGCPECKKGYKGRMGVYEIFILDTSIEELIYGKADASVIGRRAIEIGMRTLRQDALRKASMGLTSVQEVMRLTV